MAKKQTRRQTDSMQKPRIPEFKKEGNAFDKIFKEIIEKVFRPLVEERLGIKILKATPLKDKMQTTIELEMDFFYEIVPDKGEIFVLHLEFESGDNHNMVYRIGEYHGMALIRHKLPIKHILIYLGEKPPTMPTQLEPKEVYSGFDLINVQGLDTNEFLSSQIPEVVLLAILSNYEKAEAETVLRKIVLNLKKLVKNKRILKKYINQLMMLSRLRKIESLTIKIAEEMPIHFDYETDTLYIKGNEKGIEKGIENKNYTIVRNLLRDTDFTVERIALLSDVPIAFVQKVKLELTRKS